MISSADYKTPSRTPGNRCHSAGTRIITFWLDISNAGLWSFCGATHLFWVCRSAKLSPLLWIDLKDRNGLVLIGNATGCSNKELRGNGTLRQTLWSPLHLFLIHSAHHLHLLSVLFQNTNLRIGCTRRTSYHNVWFELVAFKPQGIWNFRVAWDKTRQRNFLFVRLRIIDFKVSIEKAGEIRARVLGWSKRLNYWDPFVLRLWSFLFRPFQCK
jgi:hypothetical protein